MRIVLEGPDGIGKSTIAKSVALKLRESGESVYECFEPGHTVVGMLMRDVIFNKIKDDRKTASILSFMVASAELADHLSQVGKDFDHVIMDRHSFISNSVYVRFGRESDIHWMMPAYQKILRLWKPDKYIFLLPEGEEMQGLLARRCQEKAGEGNFMDQASLDFKKRVSEGYKMFFDADFLEKYSIGSKKAAIFIRPGDSVEDITNKVLREISYDTTHPGF